MRWGPELKTECCGAPLVAAHAGRVVVGGHAGPVFVGDCSVCGKRVARIDPRSGSAQWLDDKPADTTDKLRALLPTCAACRELIGEGHAYVLVMFEAVGGSLPFADQREHIAVCADCGARAHKVLSDAR